MHISVTLLKSSENKLAYYLNTLVSHFRIQVKTSKLSINTHYCHISEYKWKPASLLLIHVSVTFLYTSENKLA